MKRFFCVFAIMLLVPSLSAAADFAPTKLQLATPETIQYEFDGSVLEIPVAVTGTAARTWFFVFTKGKAEDIVEVRNGWLGWHWVNGIDTCVYMSTPYDFGTGGHTITWNGQDSDGGVVPKDDYTYYLWAYDYITTFSANQATPRGMGFGWNRWNACPPHVQEIDEQGMPLVQPFIMDYRTSGQTSTDPSYVYRWTIGQDPLNLDLRESTMLDIPEEWKYIGKGGPFQPNPHDFTQYWLAESGPDDKGIRHRGFHWVPNDWAEFDEEPLYESNECHYQFAGITSDGNYLFWDKSMAGTASIPCTIDYIMDFDGELLASWQKDLWIAVEEHEKYGTALNLGSTQKSQRGPYVFQSTWYSVQGMLDPVRYLETGNYPDPELYLNFVGDFVLDRGTEPDCPTPFVNGMEGPPHITSHYADANYFSLCGFTGMGAVSLGVLAPDGTGVGYIAFSGETGEYRETFAIDNGSAYDGFYVNCDGIFSGEGRGGLGFLGHDTIKGVITSKVSVEDEAPNAFAVEQSSPNPANPNTTISFTLPESGNVTVDIFNMAGQKVDTLVSDFMDSGRHSVVWNGSNFSTGVYFYTVTSGEFSKTMKMTLLK